MPKEPRRKAFCGVCRLPRTKGIDHKPCTEARRKDGPKARLRFGACDGGCGSNWAGAPTHVIPCNHIFCYECANKHAVAPGVGKCCPVCTKKIKYWFFC